MKRLWLISGMASAQDSYGAVIFGGERYEVITADISPDGRYYAAIVQNTEWG